MTLVDLLKTFKTRGDKTAFIYLTGIRRFVFSYNQFYTEILKTAAWLKNQGVGQGDRVAIWAPNSPWWAITFWGIIARGGIVVPIDFNSGKERAEKIAELAECKLIIQSYYKLDKANTTANILIEDLQYLVSKVQPIAIPAIVKDEDIAELIYTSGTTGDPKGVVLTHKNLMSNLRQVNKHIPEITQKYNFLSLLPLSHMFEQMGGFFTPLMNGGRVVYIRTLKPSAIMQALKDENIYTVMTVPRLLQALKNGIEREFQSKGLGKIFEKLLSFAVHKSNKFKKILFFPIHKKFGRNFQFFISGGSALDAPTAQFWQNLGFKVIEGYGLTECAPILAGNLVSQQRIGSVGKALPGVALKLDSGEILAKGDNIFNGYWQNEKATQEAFTTDGWFRTGDLGQVDGDGWWHIKGRKKDVIVTGSGVNVYPDDIEGVLNLIPTVRESCVVAKRTASGEEVHAVLILADDSQKPENIIAEANKSLDAQQQINSFSLWPEPEFPKTTTLKIQKFRVIQSLATNSTDKERLTSNSLINLIAKVAGKSVTEVQETSVLAQDLGISSIGRLELVNYLEQEFRLDLDDALINQNTTVKSLREIIKNKEKMHGGEIFPFWSFNPVGRFIKFISNWLLHYPIFFSFVKLEKRGLENLDNLNEPSLFIANHVSYFDHPAIVFSLPGKARYFIATAAKDEFFHKDKKINKLKWVWKRFTYYYGTVALSLFPLPKDKGFRKSLEFMGKLVDNKINILIFPEGERSYDGQILPFMEGLGLMVKELQIPVIPVKIEGMEKIFPRGTAMPKRGKAIITFGKPNYFGQESPSEIVRISKKLIVNL